ncbi:hypothetical protein [Haloferax sp. DFSO52]|uniref:hypothetical protein n=1 Tax=Haloferax sp. DFSO52 TaxID=3388505 RepID=UPI003A839205
MSHTSPTLSIHRSLRAAVRFVYEHSFPLVGLSLVWVLASLPIITAGPATLGAYAAICSLREKGWIDVGEVFSIVRRQAIHAVLITTAVSIIAVMGLLYTHQYLMTGSTLAAVLGVLALYVTAHLSLVVPTALLGLSRGHPASDALETGYRWTIQHPITAVMMGSASLLLLVTSALLTVAVVLVFPAVLFSFHVLLLDDTFDPVGDLKMSPQ